MNDASTRVVRYFGVQTEPGRIPESVVEVDYASSHAATLLSRG